MKPVKILFYFLLSMTGSINAQNVGIGTTTPLEKLSVVSGFGHGISHEAGGIKLSTYIDANGGWIGTVTNNPFHLYTNNGGAQFTLLQNGNVGIGNINPQFKLDIKGRMKIQTGTIGNIFTTPGIWFDDYREGSNRIFFGMQDSIRLGIWGEGTPGAGWAFNFNARNGNVGIGTTNQSEKLEVSGNIKGSNFLYNSPVTNYYSLSGVDFRTTSIADNIQLASLQGYCWMNNGTNPILAAVHLPQDAVITSFIVYFADSHASQNLIVRLRVGHGLTSISELMAEIISSGTPGSTILSDNTILFNQVNNIGNFYFITAESSTGTWTNASLVINQIQINYTVTGPH